MSMLGKIFEENKAHKGERGRFVPNDEQLRAIETHTNTVVSAGAGSGKTTVLAYRYLSLVLDEGVDPENILTLTFTRKAALEMRTRIYTQLAKYAKDKLQHFAKAQISTIDSFIAEVVRADSVTYGITRDFSVSSKSLMGDSFESDACEEFIRGLDEGEEMNAIASVFGSDGIGDLFAFLSNNFEITGAYDAKEMSEAFFAFVKERITELRERVLRNITGYEGKSLWDHALNFKTYVLRLLCPDTETMIKNYTSLYNENDAKFSKQGGPRSEEAKEIKNVLQNCSGMLASIYTLCQALEGSEQTSLLYEAAERYMKMLRERKVSSSALEFNDISLLALDILKNNLAVRNYYKNKFRYIMIDEFQDDNEIQKEMLFLLAEKKDRGVKGVIPKPEDLDEKLFFVGDGKQSIYAFRGANVAGFNSLVHEMGTSLTMRNNYRSSPELLDFINAFFHNVFVPDNKGMEWEAEFSESGIGRKGDASHSQVTFAALIKTNSSNSESSGEETGDEKLGLLSNVDAEAEYIAEKTREIISGEDADFLGPDGKPYKPEDIAILFRAKSCQMGYERALKRRAIPYQVESSVSYPLEAVFSDFYSYLNSILFPNDLISLSSALRGPFARLTDDGIYAVLHQKEGCPLEFEDAKDKASYEAFMALRGGVSSLVDRIPISEVVTKLYFESGYEAYLRETESMSSYQEHFDILFGYAEQMDAEGGTMSDFLTFIRNNLGTRADRDAPEVKVLRAENAGVHLMTIHASKGLEFPVVFLADLSHERRNRSATKTFAHDGKALISPVALKKEELGLTSDEEDAEDKRVLYVAMTRAIQHLVMTAKVQVVKGGEAFGGKMGPHLKMFIEATGITPNNIIDSKPVILEYEREDGVRVESVMDVERISQFKDAYDSSKRYSANAIKAENYDVQKPVLATKPNRISVTSLRRDEDYDEGGDYELLERYPAEAMLSSVEDGHALFGTLCHLVLERMMNGLDYQNTECNIFIDGDLNKKLLSCAISLAERFRSSAFYGKFVDGKETKAEFRFYSYKPEADAAIEGVVDLLAISDCFNLVIDYKTDIRKNPAIHKTQVTEYVKTMEEMLKKKCYGVLFYLRDGSTSDFWDAEGNAVSFL